MNDSFTGRLADLFANPGRLMDNVGARPAWWQPGLLVFLVILATTWFVLPIQGPEQMEAMRGSWPMNQIPADEFREQVDAAANPDSTTRLLQSMGSGFQLWVFTLLFGLILGFFARMGGGQGTFKQAIGVVSWSAILPLAVGSLVRLPLILAEGEALSVSVGLPALIRLVYDLPVDSVAFKILGTYGDFASWWGLAVLVIGFQRVFTMSRGAALVSVLLPWALIMAVMATFAILFT